MKKQRGRSHHQHPELSWRRAVVRKWLNIATNNTDYSADSDSGVDSDTEQEFCDWPRESRFKNDKPDEVQVDANGKYKGPGCTVSDLCNLAFSYATIWVGDQKALPRLRRRKSETFRAQYINTKEIRICAATWNIGGRVPPDDLDLDEWLDIDEPADVYVIGRIIWLGDLNYRINLSYEQTRELISKKEWSKLVERDQLTKELKKGHTFDGWSEGILSFAPTYKYELNSESYYGEDPKAGRRTPAWCDRILSFGTGMKLLSYRRSEVKLSDHRPVTASYMVEVEVFSPKKLQRALTFTDAEIEEHDIVTDIELGSGMNRLRSGEVSGDGRCFILGALRHLPIEVSKRLQTRASMTIGALLIGCHTSLV
ncbi:UNVERIFIED_CONTAM: Type IV inositol polyphosphate 5-phosphatase 3 [Sesamum latifolium]|uniref:Type IV inositol polyphosphate 5-phosphatase 3 n=1 Tax=Sesamum latifolium TaxID=2727402 RepID=A0AAW2VV17_9LAMI